MTDATTDRRTLTQAAYGDSANLQSRQSIYEFRNETGDWWSWVLDHADWPDGATVLDVGCGPGDYLQRVRGVGLDLSFGMAREAGLYAPTCVGDVGALPVRSASIDRVLAPHMLYHAPDLELAASELSRVLKPYGVALIVTNDPTHMRHLVDQLSAAIESDSVMRFVDRFNLANGDPLLRRHFAEVSVDHWIGELTVPEAEPVIRYARSLRSLYETQLSAGVTWDDAMAALAEQVEREITDTGAWRCVTHSGVFVCQ